MPIDSFAIVQLLRRRKLTTARHIADELEVSERTVYRDLQTLTAAGIPWYFDDYAQSYRIREGYRGPFPTIPPRQSPGSERTTLPDSPRDDPQSIVTLASEAARRLLVEAEGVVQALDRLSQAIEQISGSRPK